MYVYEIFSGKKVPSRDSVICLCFALEMEPQEISLLLKHTGYPPLYPRSRRDSVILFAAKRHKTVIELDEMLRQQQLPGMPAMSAGGNVSPAAWIEDCLMREYDLLSSSPRRRRGR